MPEDHNTPLPQGSGRTLDDYVDVEDRAPKESHPAFVGPPWWMYVAIILGGSITLILTV